MHWTLFTDFSLRPHALEEKREKHREKGLSVDSSYYTEGDFSHSDLLAPVPFLARFLEKALSV